jgi:hypothetical protein
VAAVDIRATLGTPRAGAVLLALGALCAVGASLTDLCSMRPGLAYGSTAALAITALGMLRGWSWARTVGRIVCWVNVVLFAMLVVPDWDDAMTSGSYGLFARRVIARVQKRRGGHGSVNVQVGGDINVGAVERHDKAGPTKRG